MQMHRDQSERALELLYAAMRARDTAPAGSPAWRSADEQVQAIREAYLRAGHTGTTATETDSDVDADEIRLDDRMSNAGETGLESTGASDYWLVR